MVSCRGSGDDPASGRWSRAVSRGPPRKMGRGSTSYRSTPASGFGTRVGARPPSRPSAARNSSMRPAVLQPRSAQYGWELIRHDSRIKLMKVSRSAYYTRRTPKPGPRARRDQELTTLINEVHTQSRGTYGAPRIHAALLREGHTRGRRRIARMMREAGVAGRHRRRSHRTTVPDPEAGNPRDPQDHRQAWKILVDKEQAQAAASPGSSFSSSSSELLPRS
ncbi:IS3 family transposase [Streptomyces sp. NPDC048257]|uniref:IS3 family transposase n=1 Tax=Streptomyces sp. NPDC048257 TaxID=3365526 RepID=UPI003711019E